MNFKNAKIYTERFKFEDGSFSVENGLFTNVCGAPADDAIDLKGAYVIPGLIDTHTHGNSNEDFSDGSFEGLVKMAEYYAANGITSFLPTSLTLPYEVLDTAFRTARRLADDTPTNCARVAGIHMEGPYFAESRKGAQNAAHLKNPDYEGFKVLHDNCGKLVSVVDVAPELPGAAEFISRAKNDCTVSIAHTDSGYDDAAAAIAAGVTGLTHMYNAMNGIHHRKPGPIVAAAEDERVMAELISDGQHVHPASVRFAFKVFGAERIVLISDSLRCCGMPDGDYSLGGLPIKLSGGVARLLDGTIAGSCTNVYDCMLRAISFGIPKEDAVRAATYNPAAHIGALNSIGSIANGKSADFVICDSDLNRQEVYLRGVRL